MKYVVFLPSTFQFFLFQNNQYGSFTQMSLTLFMCIQVRLSTPLIGRDYPAKLKAECIRVKVSYVKETLH